MTIPDLGISEIEFTDKNGDHQKVDFTLEILDPNTKIQQKQVLDNNRANFELIKEELGSINRRGMLHNTQRKNFNCHRTPYPNNANEAYQ
ncbi:hypothetical protein FHG87_001762 [Trinorchestia longiramus]|nr:hypothetical protein FHG87_001762 [Trinorchestia longiramus]